MTTKMKGLLKGLRYISQIFDEEKEQEMKIGFPTDVKHVAHIGMDGPSVDSPSWMKEFKAPGAFQSAPLAPPPGESKDNPADIQWVSEDSNRRSRKANPSQSKDQPELPKSSRRHSSAENGNGTDSPKKESTKSRSSRRHHSKETPEGSRSSRQIQVDSTAAGSESPARNLPDIPKKSRRKKSRESLPSVSGTTTRSSRSKGGAGAGTSSSTAPTMHSDPGPDTGSESSIRSSRNREGLKSLVDDERDSSVIS